MVIPLMIENIMCEENTALTLLTVAIGIVIGLVIFNYFPETLLKSARTAIEECENTLPRNQHCIITAIPETQK